MGCAKIVMFLIQNWSRRACHANYHAPGSCWADGGIYVQTITAGKPFACRWDPYKTEADGFDSLFPKGTPMDVPGATDLYLMAMDAIYALEVRAQPGASAPILSMRLLVTCAKKHPVKLPRAAHGATICGCYGHPAGCLMGMSTACISKSLLIMLCCFGCIAR